MPNFRLTKLLKLIAHSPQTILILSTLLLPRFGTSARKFRRDGTSERDYYVASIRKLRSGTLQIDQFGWRLERGRGLGPGSKARRAGGTGLISGRKAFQRPMKEGAALLYATQYVYLDKNITIA